MWIPQRISDRRLAANMPPSTLLSPSELAYLHTSLSLDPPVRPDARFPTSFRPLVAETDLLPSTNGSARLCFADGSEAIVGVKAEVERTSGSKTASYYAHEANRGRDEDTKMHTGEADMDEERRQQARGKGQDSWIEVSVDMPGFGRDDDGVVVFLAQMLREGLVADRGLRDRLWIGWGWHWRVYVDVRIYCDLSDLTAKSHAPITFGGSSFKALQADVQ